MMTVYNFGWSI